MCIIVPNFAKIGRTDPEIWTIFNFSKWRPCAILNFQKLEILTAHTLLSAKIRHRAKFRGDRSNRAGDMDDFRFFNMAAVRHLRFVFTRVGTTHEEYLVVFVTVQNLVVIDAAISIVCKF